MSQESGAHTTLDAELSSDSARFHGEVKTAFNGVLRVLKVNRGENGSGAVADEQRDGLRRDISTIELSRGGNQSGTRDEAFDGDQREDRIPMPGPDRRPSLGELTSFLIAGLEDARRREGTVDARHIIAQLNESLRRRASLPESGHGAERFDEVCDFFTAARDFRFDGVDPYFLARPADNFGSLPLRGRVWEPALTRPKAVASRFDAGSKKPSSGIKLDLAKSDGSIDFPERGATIDFRNRRTVLTFGLPSFGLSYQLQLNSSRVTSRRAAAERSSRIGAGAAACALLVAGVLLYALPGLPSLPTIQPRRVALAEPTKPTAPQQDAHATQPLVSLMRVPLFEEKASATDSKASATESAPVAIAAPEHVVTRSTTNLRARPEQGAQVVRVVPGRLILTAFAHSDDWVQVGGAEAWGWIPSSFVSPFVPKKE